MDKTEIKQLKEDLCALKAKCLQEDLERSGISKICFSNELSLDTAKLLFSRVFKNYSKDQMAKVIVAINSSKEVLGFIELKEKIRDDGESIDSYVKRRIFNSNKEILYAFYELNDQRLFVFKQAENHEDFWINSRRFFRPNISEICVYYKQLTEGTTVQSTNENLLTVYKPKDYTENEFKDLFYEKWERIYANEEYYNNYNLFFVSDTLKDGRVGSAITCFIELTSDGLKRLDECDSIHSFLRAYFEDYGNYTCLHDSDEFDDEEDITEFLSDYVVEYAKNKQSTTNTTKGNMKNLFNFNLSIQEASITFDGLIAINTQYGYRAVNNEGEYIEVEPELLLLKDSKVLFPVFGKEPEEGDFIKQGSDWFLVKKNNEVINLSDGTITKQAQKRNQLFSVSVFYRCAIKDMSSFNNPMMLMLLNNNEGNNNSENLLTLLMMQNSENKADMMSNPLLMAALLKKEGDANNLLPLLMMQNGENKMDMNNPLFMMALLNKEGNANSNLLALMMMQQQKASKPEAKPKKR